MSKINPWGDLGLGLDLELVKALLKLNVEGKKISGVAVMIRDPELGENYRPGEVKMFSKKPIRIGLGYRVNAEYGMTIDLGLSHRKVIGDIKLTDNIHIVSFEGHFDPYHVIAVLDDLEELRMPTQKPSEITVAFSDRAPENGEDYECTAVEKCNDGNTATNRKCFNIASVTYYGNLALCETDGKPLLVTYHA